MSLHNDIKNYINELQELLNETDEQKLIDKAYAKWGEDDSRYEVLEQFVESSRGSSKSATRGFDSFDKPSGPPADTKPDLNGGGQK